MSLKFFAIVKEQSACIVERFGKYHKTLQPGFHFLLPIIDNISYKMSLKEDTITVENQQAITKDNVTVLIGGTLFIRIDDPFKASYNVERPLEAVKLLALTVLRSEIGKMKLDKLFQERQELNKAVNLSVNKAASIWGINCLRYEILQIDPPNEIKTSMQYEAEAERLKRREVVISEGKQISEINQSEGKKISQIKRAEGDAESVKLVSEQESIALEQIGKAFEAVKNSNTVQYVLLQNYLKTYENTLRESNLIVAPGGGKQGGVQKDGSDLMTIAAMMMLGGANQGRGLAKVNETSSNISSRQISTGNESSVGSNNNSSNSRVIGSQQAMNLSNTDYSDLIEKTKFYEDPILYSSDEETKRRTSAQHQSSYGSQVDLSQNNQSSQPVKLRR